MGNQELNQPNLLQNRSGVICSIGHNPKQVIFMTVYYKLIVIHN